VSVLTKRRQAPVVIITIVAAAATLALGALPLSGGVRAAFVTLVLAVAAREISATCRHAAIAAVHEDRRRVARDLHDGLAQELAFISSQGKRLAKSFDEEIASYMGIAAQRALDESRTLIAALSRTSQEPLERAIARAAQDVAVRAGASVELSVEPHMKLEREAEDALVRIVREAVTNAVRHGGAENVRVQLVRSGGLLLRVDDDGRGISEQPVAGFGLASMRERAEGLGGSFRLLPRSNGGTIVEISLP
jgi:signal transduction histidine kinase